MMRIASVVAEKLGIGAILTGESLGQVASQTVDGMTCSGACAKYPVLRPCIAMDKEEIVAISKKNRHLRHQYRAASGLLHGLFAEKSRDTSAPESGRKIRTSVRRRRFGRGGCREARKIRRQRRRIRQRRIMNKKSPSAFNATDF